MRSRYPAIAVMGLVLAGCSGNANTPSAGVPAGSAGVSSSASAPAGTSSSAAVNPTASASLSPSCQRLEATVRGIPKRIQQAATSGQPVKDVPRVIQQIQQELTSDVNGDDSELKAAVQRYADALRQAARNVSNGKVPDFSTINPSRIEELCSAGGA